MSNKKRHNQKNNHSITNYEPQTLLDIEGSNNDIELARKMYQKVAASCLPTGSTSFRGNAAYRGQDMDKYGALENSFMTPKMAIRLSQVVYYKFGLIRHAIDTMAEFTVSEVDFLSKKKAARDAMLGWASGVGLKSFLDQVALEYYRSGNVYIYRFESRIKDSAVRDLNNLFGLKTNSSVMIPTKYTIIDPNLVNFVSGNLFNNYLYQIVIPASEAKLIIQQYKSKPEELQQLPVEFSDAIKKYLGGNSSRAGDLVVALKPENIIVLYRKKQPYEPYAWPFLSGAFDDLEFRQELRNMDKALSRVIAKILIHVAVGDKDHIPSPEALDAIRNKLSNASTSTYLITDGAVKINQYYPDIANMLDPKKYEAVNKDILTALGISDAVYGNGAGSFSNNFLGIKVLVERIVDGRDKILKEFLIPECKRMSKLFNFKTEVKPEIKGADLNDEKEMAKIYTRLYEDGVFSPQSVIESIRDSRLPTYDEEVERQQEAKELKDQGLFVPSANRGGDSQKSGRPTGESNKSQTGPKSTTPNGSNAVIIRSFTKEEHATTINEALSYLKSELNINKFSKEQKKFVENACTDFLLKQSYNHKDLTEFLNQIYNKTTK